MQAVRFESMIKTFKLPVFFWDTHNLSFEIHKNFHEDIEFMYCYAGSGDVLCDNEHITLQKGDFCCINSMLVHRAKPTKGNDFSFYNLTVNTDYCSANNIDIKKYIFEKKFNDAIAAEKITNLCNCYHDLKNPLYTAKFNSVLLDFIIHIIENHSIKNSEISEKNSTIRYTIGYINAHFEEKLTIDEISRQAGLSKYHLSREFKKVTGHTITDYLNILRCQKACQFLKTGAYSVKDVFNLSCFDSYSYFSTVFKKHIGVSPSEYKNNPTNDGIN